MSKNARLDLLGIILYVSVTEISLHSADCETLSILYSGSIRT